MTSGLYLTVGLATLRGLRISLRINRRDHGVHLCALLPIEMTGEAEVAADRIAEGLIARHIRLID